MNIDTHSADVSPPTRNQRLERRTIDTSTTPGNEPANRKERYADNDSTVPTNDDDTEGHAGKFRGLSDAGTEEGDDTEGHIAQPGRPLRRGLSDAGTEEGDDTEGHLARSGRIADAGPDEVDTEGHATQGRGVTATPATRRAATPKATSHAWEALQEGR